MRRPSKNRLVVPSAALLGACAAVSVLGFLPAPSPISSFRADDARAPAAAAAPFPAPRLLFITLDGVRPDEFFDCPASKTTGGSQCSFPFLWKEIEAKRFEASPMEVGNSRNLSLPGYQTIYSGAAQDATCIDNERCDRVPVRTWLEKIRAVRGLPRPSVAAIASWNRMPKAVERFPGTIFVNAGPERMTDPTKAGDPVPEELSLASQWQTEAMYLPEWENARADRFTFTYAQWYLAHVKPEILAVGFLDSDELAHLDRYPAYLKKLRTYDGYIRTLIEDLKASGRYENTIVFVTTDHGRGDGYFGYAFKGHGPEWYLAHSHRAWAAISVPDSLRTRWISLKKRLGDSAFNQRDIRPLIEGLMLTDDGASAP